MSPAKQRPESRFVCQSCAAEQLRWEGQCRACGAWNTLVETVVERAPSRTAHPTRPSAAATALGAVTEAERARRPVGIDELDRVLGGGLVPGSIILIGGEPGIGKSTLVLQAAAGLAAAGADVLYASGEESPAQVRLRASRLGLLSSAAADSIRLLAESEVGTIVEAARASGPAVLVVDSIQTATTDELDGPAGSVGQVRQCALRLTELAKDSGIAVILVGHVTKDGTLAGPKTLEHLVDAVLTLEGERYASLRVLRTVKNRFGSTEEVGVFEMGEDGLAEVADPARAFLVEHAVDAPGSVVVPTMEGTRPLLVEVQALVAPAGYGNPRRTASGIDPNRLALLIAVLARRAGLGLGTHDVYANAAGGLRVDEPAADLALAAALASSLRDAPIDRSTVAVGEIGLLGELRTVAGLERRLREAARLGFRRAGVPRAGRGAVPAVDGIQVVAVGTVRDALEALLGPAAAGRGRGVRASDRDASLGGGVPGREREPGSPAR